MRRIGASLNLGSERDRGLFLGVRLLSPRAFDSLPSREDAFEDLRDWLGPRLVSDPSALRGEILEPAACRWEPVGTPAEYLAANLDPPPLPYARDPHPLAAGMRVLEYNDGTARAVVGAGATVADEALLERAVVWDGESVPPGTRVENAVFAGGGVHDCAEGAA